jgi:hexosaminidase
MWSRLLLALLVLRPVSAIWPAPVQHTQGNTPLFIQPGISITYNGAPVCWFSSPDGSCPNNACTKHNILLQLPYVYDYTPHNVFNSRDIVTGGVSRALAAIFQDGFVPWKLHRANTITKFEPSLLKGQNWIKSLAITQTGKDTKRTFKPAAGEVDESYNLTITTNGHASITAVSSVGVLRALESFVQLFYKHSKGPFTYTPFAPVHICDAPKFPHRGLLLDVARQWYDMKDILRTIEAMSWNKMNRLHLHITDSQSWPLELPSMPEVALKGAYAADLTYGPDDIEEIHTYAIARGIEVIIEIDMPGHIGSLYHSHPELIVAYDGFPYYWWCAQPPCGAFKLNDTRVDDFLEKMFNDLLPRLAPYTAYFHTGGDELKANDSMLDEGIRSNATEVLQPLLQKFIDKQHARVRKAGLAPMVWEEILLQWNVTVGKDTVIQTWLGNEAIKELTGKGFKVIDSNYNVWVSKRRVRAVLLAGLLTEANV